MSAIGWRRIGLVSLVVGVALLGGCLDATVTTVVTEDGEIDEMEVEMETLSAVHSLLELSAEMEGHEDVEAMLEASFRENVGPENVGSVSAETENLGEDKHLLAFTATDVDPESMDDITITADGDTVRFEAVGSMDVLDQGAVGTPPTGGGATTAPELTSYHGGNQSDPGDVMEEWEAAFAELEEFFQQLDADIDNIEDFLQATEEGGENLEGLMTVDYVVEMPGEIGETNADEVSSDGTTASWSVDLLADGNTTIVAESDTDGTGGAAGDSVPGFGIGLASAAVLATLVVAGRRARG